MINDSLVGEIYIFSIASFTVKITTNMPFWHSLINKTSENIMATRIKNKKLSKSSKAWMQEHLDDHFVQKAHKDGYRARAAYKLLEINDKYSIITKGMTVVDLGAAPGSWSQIAATLVGETGMVIASDILPMDKLADVTFIQGDFREDEALNQIMDALNGRPVDVVICDMAPNTTGHNSVDQARMMYLCELAYHFALETLKPDGTFLMKVFQGEGIDVFRKTVQASFVKIKSVKPAASRARSKEMYWLAEGIK